MSKRKILCSALVAAMLFGGPVQPVKAAGVELIQVHGNDQIRSFVISDTVNEDKTALDTAVQAQLGTSARSAARSIYSYADSVSASDYTEDGNGKVKSSFDVDIYVDGFPGYVVESEGKSSDFWTGTNPFRADSITSSDIFKYDTFGVASLSISAPAATGIIFSTGTDSAVLTYPVVTNEYSYYHTFSGIKAETGVLGSITKYTHTHSNTMLFGNRTVTSSCNDSTIVW